MWDVHTNVDRWWVITEPMNLYSQEQFPNLDLALTFHVGLCLRIPRAERHKLSELPIEAFAEAYRYLEEAPEALRHSSDVADYQAIGVRCREALPAEAGIAATENAISLSTNAIIRHVRGVPERCPECGSQRLSPERGYRQDLPDVEWERPVCDKCGWTGTPVPLKNVDFGPPQPTALPDGECITPTVPLRQLRRPSDES